MGAKQLIESDYNVGDKVICVNDFSFFGKKYEAGRIFNVVDIKRDIKIELSAVELPGELGNRPFMTKADDPDFRPATKAGNELAPWSLK